MGQRINIQDWKIGKLDNVTLFCFFTPNVIDIRHDLSIIHMRSSLVHSMLLNTTHFRSINWVSFIQKVRVDTF